MPTGHGGIQQPLPVPSGQNAVESYHKQQAQAGETNSFARHGCACLYLPIIHCLSALTNTCTQSNQTLHFIVATPLPCIYTCVWPFSIVVSMPLCIPTKHSIWHQSSHVPLADTGDGLAAADAVARLGSLWLILAMNPYHTAPAWICLPVARLVVADPGASSNALPVAVPGSATSILATGRQIHVPCCPVACPSQAKAPSSSQMHNRC